MLKFEADYSKVINVEVSEDILTEVDNEPKKKEERSKL